jgi:hypothetical protein
MNFDNMEMQLNEVRLTFHYNKPSGEEVIIEASIDETGNWQQWKANKSELADNVSLIEEITGVVNQYRVNN